MPAKFLLLCSLFFCTLLHAQTDSLSYFDSSKNIATTHNDSVLKPPEKKAALRWQQDTAFNRFFINKNVPRNKQSVYAINAVRHAAHQDEQFYILAGLLLFTGMVRTLFPKYFTTLFQLFFQSSQRQRQSKENIAHAALPSFLLNLVFIFSGGLLLANFFKDDDFPYHLSFPLLWLFACGALAVIYIVKSLFISFAGWSFAAKEPADNYKFIVFLVNKIAGLFFIPLVLILTYSSAADFSVFATIAIAFVSILLIYRYIVSLGTIGKKLKIHPLHFFLYLCAVEILPLLITYKLLLITKEL